MKNKNINSKKLLHQSRTYKFGIIEIPDVKKYFESSKGFILTLIFSILLFTFLFLFSEYKEWALRIGIFAILFNIYKIFKILTEPSLKLNNKGIYFNSIRFYWKDIKKIKTNWENGNMFLNITLNSGKLVKEKIENFNIYDFLKINLTVRSYKRKYRNKFIYK